VPALQGASCFGGAMFDEILHKIASHVDGVRGSLLLDPDSVPIAEHYVDGSDEAIGALGIELSNLVNSLERRDALDESGSVREFSMATDNVVALCRTIGGQYVLLVAMDPVADIERGQTMVRLMAPWIERLL